MSSFKFRNLFIVFCVLLYSTGCAQAQQESKVCAGNNCFLVEVARTPDYRTQGLMGRESLPRDRGMLFIFPKEGIHGFWMKDTKFPLDIIWLNSAKEVVYIERFAHPCQTTACSPMFPKSPAKYVLEINAGLADTVGIMVGRVLEFKLVN